MQSDRVVSKPVKQFKNSYLLSIVSDPVNVNRRILVIWRVWGLAYTSAPSRSPAQQTVLGHLNPSCLLKVSVVCSPPTPARQQIPPLLQTLLPSTVCPIVQIGVASNGRKVQSFFKKGRKCWIQKVLSTSLSRCSV